MSTIEIEDLRPTIVPKSDQLNAEQLLGGPMTITITSVRIGTSNEQPVSLHYENDGGRPFKPCKTMRKVLIFAWGEDGRNWVGKSMTLYNDQAVKFGGEDVGGIRISHLSDIPRDVRVSLTATKGKKALHEIKVLRVEQRVDHLALIQAATTVEALKLAFGPAYKSTREAPTRESFKKAYDARLRELTTSKTLAEFIDDINNATDADAALIPLQAGKDALTPSEVEDLVKAYRMAWE